MLYQEYQERVQKEIHDQKMAKFLDHTLKVKEAVDSKSPDRRPQKRIDTGLRRSTSEVRKDYKVSISPSRKKTDKVFTVKPS